MKIFVTLIWTLHATLALPLAGNKKPDINALKRKSRSADGTIGCIHMESFPGELKYTSDGNTDVCGLYLIGQPDQIVEIEFVEFNVRCETGGILAVFDGWELQGELFPGSFDHHLTMEERYKTYCGRDRPSKLFISSQNVALIQFKLPEPGEGFKLFVTFKANPQPCNAVAMFDEGVITMKNYGLRRNCTVSIIYPEVVSVLNIDVGITAETKLPDGETETGLRDSQCLAYSSGDYVQLMNGNGLDTALMRTRALYCGLESSSEKNLDTVLGCQHSVVRMVSSGAFYNTVTFQYSPPLPEELTKDVTTC